MQILASHESNQLGMALLQSLGNKSLKFDPKKVFAMGVILLEKAAAQGHKGARNALHTIEKNLGKQ